MDSLTTLDREELREAYRGELERAAEAQCKTTALRAQRPWPVWPTAACGAPSPPKGMRSAKTRGGTRPRRSLASRRRFAYIAWLMAK
jgi:hypothetical protein